MSDYKDQFTLDGKLKPQGRVVSRAKVEAADKLLKRAMQGDAIRQVKRLNQFLNGSCCLGGVGFGADDVELPVQVTVVMVLRGSTMRASSGATFWLTMVS